MHYLDFSLAFLAPNINSSKRLAPHHWSGHYKVWGIDNKEAAIRLIGPIPSHENITHFEVKAHDHLANPYLAMASIIFSGGIGLEGKIKPENYYDENPAILSEKE